VFGPFQRGSKVHVGGTIPAEGVPSGLHPQDLARCYGWKFPAHAVRERKPALRTGCSPSTEQWREKNGPPLTHARLRPWHQHSKRWTKREAIGKS